MSTMPLSADYQPSPCTVVIGKGRLPMHAEGNKNLRTIVKSFLEAYSAADHKSVKSNIVSNVYSIVVNSCPEGEAFVKYDGEYFFPVTDHQAREKVAGTFRDCLSHKYKSSSKNKVAKRRQARQNKRKQQEQPEPNKQEQEQQCEPEMTSAWMVPPPLEKIVTPELTLSNFNSSKSSSGAFTAPPLPAMERVRTFSIPSMNALLDAPSRQSLVNFMNAGALRLSFAGPIDIDFDFSEFATQTQQPVKRASNTISDDDEDLRSLSSAESSCMFDQHCHGDCDIKVAV